MAYERYLEKIILLKKLSGCPILVDDEMIAHVLTVQHISTRL
jgi:hypothetical protein